MMASRMVDGKVLVDDPARGSQLYSRGYFGNPLSGGGVELDLVEATYLMEMGKLDVLKGGRRLRMEDLLRAGHTLNPNFEIRYLVYRDLRQRGYVVKPGIPPLDFRVFPRGTGPDKGPTKYWVLAISERSVFDIEELESYIADVANVRKQLIVAVVDEESDITFYRVSKASPRGDLKEDGGDSPTEALFMKDRAIILDPEKASGLYGLGFYGRMLGDKLQLSLLETVYLAKRGLLVVRRAQTGRRIGLATLLKDAKAVQPDLEMRLKVYEDLKGRGVIVKTGFKYGSHFRGYEGDPEEHHAKYLIHALPEGFRGMWPEISRAVRLAHGVRKEILLGRLGPRVEYIRLQRIRP
ncbi:MAG: tRNA-intron lyase [Candidatus Thermoplasmatota archaeon]|nr:tRNA-intron lyase [Candidatus Thermoplasmatota archaeon]